MLLLHIIQYNARLQPNIGLAGDSSYSNTSKELITELLPLAAVQCGLLVYIRDGDYTLFR